MTSPSTVDADTWTRAAASGGQSDGGILEALDPLLAPLRGGVVVDLGCGGGGLFSRLPPEVEYVGCDAVRYDAFPAHARARFVEADLNRPPFPIPSASAEAVLSVEAIEHLENPRALFREMLRIARPGALLVVTTPNQLSLLSKLTLVLKNQFNAFQEAPGLYPAHITALLESDLRRIATECGATAIEIRYTDCGRIPWTSRQWPRRLGGGRLFSDNVVLVARRPS